MFVRDHISVFQMQTRLKAGTGLLGYRLTPALQCGNICNALQSERRKRFIIHCSSEFSGGCDGSVQFHVRIQSSEVNLAAGCGTFDSQFLLPVFAGSCIQTQTHLKATQSLPE